jgi:hypothetical protein
LLSGINTYIYTANNPINSADLYGLAVGDYPPPPPGYDAETWKTNQWDNGKWALTDPDGNNWTIHPEDKGHWRHWDKTNSNGKSEGQWPPNSKKPWPGQKKPKPDQCPVDPNEDAEPWVPPIPELVPPIPAPENADNSGQENPPLPFMPIPEWLPGATYIRIPTPIMPIPVIP